jgi:integrase
MACEPATRETPDDEDARRARKATANRILTMLKAALNRAFHADRVSSDSAWRKVKPFRKVDEAVVRYLSPTEARRLVAACPEDFRKLVRAALLTGCRYSELARLKCSNFNSDSGTLAIRLSKGKIRHTAAPSSRPLSRASHRRNSAWEGIAFQELRSALDQRFSDAPIVHSESQWRRWQTISRHALS